MNWLRPLIRECRLFYLHWAMCDIHPLHPDLPDIVTEIRELEAERQAPVRTL